MSGAGSSFGGTPDRDMLAVWAECERMSGGRGICAAGRTPAKSAIRERIEEEAYRELREIERQHALLFGPGRAWGEGVEP